MNPIESAVDPLKNDAMDRAEQYAREVIVNVTKKLEAANFDLEVAAPYPRNIWDRNEYSRMMSKRNLFSMLTKSRKSSRKMIEPDYVDMDKGYCDKFIIDSRKDAADQYDAFVAKLIKKIGAVKSAELTGNHVWSFSILKVETEAGEIQKWKTQMIINVSKLGKVFNQWPTRKVK